MDLLEGIHDGFNIVPDHADVSPFDRSLRAHRVGEELAALGDHMTTRLAPLDDGLHIARIHARLDENRFHLALDDLRRTGAKLCHINGGELEQIQFLPRCSSDH